jgi:hypothetical protein
MVIKKYSKEELEKMDDLTDYERVNNMTEDENRKNAESDPDVLLQSEEDLKRFKRANKKKYS